RNAAATLPRTARSPKNSEGTWYRRLTHIEAARDRRLRGQSGPSPSHVSARPWPEADSGVSGEACFGRKTERRHVVTAGARITTFKGKSPGQCIYRLSANATREPPCFGPSTTTSAPGFTRL